MANLSYSFSTDRILQKLKPLSPTFPVKNNAKKESFGLENEKSRLQTQAKLFSYIRSDYIRPETRAGNAPKLKPQLPTFVKMLKSASWAVKSRPTYIITEIPTNFDPEATDF